MYRYILTALTAGVILLAFAVLPPILSGSALAQKKDPTTDAINLNSSRSNIDRMGGGGGTATTVKSSKSNTSDRMGGGGGTKGGAGAGLAITDPGDPGPKGGKPKTK
jgi:hypothetical protein